MQASGVRRIVVVSAAYRHRALSVTPASAEARSGDGFFMRHLASPAVKAAFRENYADLARMEEVLRDSGLDWTAVRPPG